MNNDARILIDNIVFMVKELLKGASFDKTETARIVDIKVGNKYTIMINNIKYDNISTLSGNTFVKNETVKVVIPQGNYSQMFILGKLG